MRVHKGTGSSEGMSCLSFLKPSLSAPLLLEESPLPHATVCSAQLRAWGRDENRSGRESLPWNCRGGGLVTTLLLVKLPGRLKLESHGEGEGEEEEDRA